MSDDLSRPVVAVILPAAGSGLRMGGVRKQFRSLGDYPLFVQTLRAFDRHPRISISVVVVPADEVTTVEAMLADAALQCQTRVVAGGATRSMSVRAGLEATDPGAEIILVHDAVRPFIASDLIDSIIDAAESQGAASLAIPVTDSLRRGSEGVFGELVERLDTYRVQTPQGFRREILEAAHARAALVRDTATTDDASLAIAAGYVVEVVPGSGFNFKVTTDEDWLLASVLWDSWDELKVRRH